jgi:hypothetical protein
LDGDLFTLSSDMSLYIQTTDPAKVKDYTIKVHGKMAYFSEELTFVVSVTNVCPNVIISPPLDLPAIL